MEPILKALIKMLRYLNCFSEVTLMKELAADGQNPHFYPVWVISPSPTKLAGTSERDFLGLGTGFLCVKVVHKLEDAI